MQRKTFDLNEYGVEILLVSSCEILNEYKFFIFSERNFERSGGNFLIFDIFF